MILSFISEKMWKRALFKIYFLFNILTRFYCILLLTLNIMNLLDYNNWLIQMMLL